ncbi:unnamed protein product [Caenorhabditis sp. 36 PRJEB53466]|nr:unnamed protein product [Caenorhabditis sp. 36 PRJEB53466]
MEIPCELFEFFRPSHEVFSGRLGAFGLVAFFASTAVGSIIWTSSSNNCTCKPINSLFMGRFSVNDNRCEPDAACRQPTSNNYMIIFFPPEYRPPHGDKMALALLAGRNAPFKYGPFNVTEAFDPICVNGTWYVQKFPFEIQYTRNDNYQQEFMDPTDLNNKRLKHEIRSVMCGA